MPDSGYPGAWLITALLHCGIPFCLRCDFLSSFKAVTTFRNGVWRHDKTVPEERYLLLT